jgi:hypothetical protein
MRIIICSLLISHFSFTVLYAGDGSPKLRGGRKRTQNAEFRQPPTITISTCALLHSVKVCQKNKPITTKCLLTNNAVLDFSRYSIRRYFSISTQPTVQYTVTVSRYIQPLNIEQARVCVLLLGSLLIIIKKKGNYFSEAVPTKTTKIYFRLWFFCCHGNHTSSSSREKLTL